MLPVLDQMEPMMTLSKTDQMNVYFSGGTFWRRVKVLEITSSGSQLPRNSPYRINNQSRIQPFLELRMKKKYQKMKMIFFMEYEKERAQRFHRR